MSELHQERDQASNEQPAEAPTPAADVAWPELPSQQLHGPEAIDVGHPNVDQQQRELAPRQQPDSLQSRGSLDKLVTERLQDRAVSDQVSWRVIDEK